jgi:hypothetical protein
METLDFASNSTPGRVMDWHDEIFIPTHLRRSIGMEQSGAYGEIDEDNASNLLILKDGSASEFLDSFSTCCV